MRRLLDILRRASCALALALPLAGLPALAASPELGPSGLPLPRFVSLAAEPINIRTGPGKQYPLKWVYARRGLPVQIVDEFDTWRKIRDLDGEEGWVHGSLLSRRRTVLLTGAELLGLRRAPAADARLLLRAEPGVVGGLLDCSEGWCFVEIEGQRGWLERTALYGILPDEMRR
ncbi:SH3 domain-containing protein [Marinimicrococcus flavescens]|uniref:SH3 domain-containing protein n=1 Tax=Marinimicrococcus flavescens TaxID=3031815 RepID=A0AAP3XQP9_9PROT|nr:SH3 domain-containing protein [Marinimicrococcus flavescens]